MKKVFVILLLLSTSIVYAQKAKVIAGPMLGYNTMKECAIWVQTDHAATVELEYWDSSDRKAKTKSLPVQTDRRKGYTATLIMDYLEPGTTYTYQVLVNGKACSKTGENFVTTQKLWQYREDPPKFSFVAGSCMFANEKKYDRPGKPYGQSNEIFNAIAKEDADFMMWLGDNVYLREADWNSRSGIYHRYSHMRQIPELKSLLKGMHHYAIWDDHDYGPNDSDWTYWNKDITREAFTDYWANPNYGIGGSDGITGSFWWNDCQFFLMDNRWYRDLKGGSEAKILGDQQMKWLVDALRSSKANFKFVAVGGQMLSDNAVYENHAVYAAERQKLIDAIDLYNIKNVIFLSGDRHSSELSRYKTADGDVIYDVTSSPLTSKSYDHSKEPNTLRVGNNISESSYAIIQIEGKFRQRKATLIYKNKNGEVIAFYPLLMK